MAVTWEKLLYETQLDAWTGSTNLATVGDLVLGGTNKRITFGTNDYIEYVANIWYFKVDGVTKFTVDAGTNIIENTYGIRLGGGHTYDSDTWRLFSFDTGWDALVYNSTDNRYEFWIGSEGGDVATLDDTGFALTGTNRRITFDTNDYFQYDTTNNYFQPYIGSVNVLKWGDGTAQYGEQLQKASWAVPSSGIGDPYFCLRRTQISVASGGCTDQKPTVIGHYIHMGNRLTLDGYYDGEKWWQHYHCIQADVYRDNTEDKYGETLSYGGRSSGIHVGDLIEGVEQWAADNQGGSTGNATLKAIMGVVSKKAASNTYSSYGVQSHADSAGQQTTYAPTASFYSSGAWQCGVYLAGTYNQAALKFKPATNTIVEFDSNDYLYWVAASSRWEFRIGGACKFYIDSTGGHDGAP